MIISFSGRFTDIYGMPVLITSLLSNSDRFKEVLMYHLTELYKNSNTGFCTRGRHIFEFPLKGENRICIF